MASTRPISPLRAGASCYRRAELPTARTLGRRALRAPTTRSRRRRSSALARLAKPARSTTAASPPRTCAPRSASKAAAGCRIAARARRRMGISRRTIAAEALAEVFGELDERALIDARHPEAAARPAGSRRDQRRAGAALSVLMRQGFSPAGVCRRRCGRLRTGAGATIRTEQISHASRHSPQFPRILRAERPHASCRARRSSRPTTRRCSSPTPG